MGRYSVVAHLLSLKQDGSKIDINYANLKGKTPLHKAAFNGHHQIVLLLLENGADPRLND